MEPSCYNEAVNSQDKNKWLEAMKDEIKSFKVNQTWTLVTKPKDRKHIDCRWLFKIKEGFNPSNLPRYKARLVAKCFTQHEGIDFNEIF